MAEEISFRMSIDDFDVGYCSFAAFSRGAVACLDMRRDLHLDRLVEKRARDGCVAYVVTPTASPKSSTGFAITSSGIELQMFSADSSAVRKLPVRTASAMPATPG